jgi:hypothetical protein
MKMIKDLLVGL